MVIIEEQLKYIYNLKYFNVKSIEYYNNNKINKNIYSLLLDYNDFINININKLPNTLFKFKNCFSFDYLNNLPLNLKYLFYNRVNCNLPPNIIYLYCVNYNIYNLPRYIQFIYIYSKYNKLIKELIDYNYYKNNINFIYSYKDIIKLKSIY